ncbi:MAG: UDP-3-O-(3-hydroxymyristoyl)glucosamine N-acyltransferase [Bacteroidales bacterium]|jgi:UDP-3-O-[3-hydroxymyristoyl] glucosamine N-acyltransferase
MEFTAQHIAELAGGKIIGNPDAIVNNISGITEAKEGSLCFLSNMNYSSYVYTTKAAVVIVSSGFKPEKPFNTTLIAVDDPYYSFAKLLQKYSSIINPPKEGISEKSTIAECAKIGKNTYIGEYVVVGKNVTIGDNAQIYPLCYIGDNVTIGDDTILYPSVVIYYNSRIGNGCTLHSGVVIGSDGFGFAPQNLKEYEKIPQIGNVIIEDHVEIGSNTVVDRATLGSTIIRKGVKLDNLIQIAHNVEIGENTVMAAQTGVAGSTILGKNMMVGGQVGFKGHMKIADEVKIAAQSGLISSVKEKGISLMGAPAFEYSKYMRAYTLFRNIEQLNNKINSLEKEIEQLKTKQ